MKCQPSQLCPCLYSTVINMTPGKGLTGPSLGVVIIGIVVHYKISKTGVGVRVHIIIGYFFNSSTVPPRESPLRNDPTPP